MISKIFEIELKYYYIKVSEKIENADRVNHILGRKIINYPWDSVYTFLTSEEELTLRLAFSNDKIFIREIKCNWFDKLLYKLENMIKRKNEKE